MASPISRRRFLRDSAVVSGGALLVGSAPSIAGSAPSLASAAPPAALYPSRGRRSHGLFAEIEYGDASDDFLVQWTRAGGSATLQLTSTVVRLDVPIFGAEEIDLADFEQGRGEHEVVRYFGAPALDQLRNEVSSLRLFST